MNTLGTTAPWNTLQDRVAIVTGGGTGIGRAAALALAGTGAHVLVTGRREAALAQTAAGDPRIAAHVADVRDAGTAQETIAAALDRWGRLDVLVNNAGLLAAFPLGQATAAKVLDLFTTNVVGPTLLAAAAVPHLKEHGGCIINVSSAAAGRPAPGAAHYAASKAALDQLTRSWALELAPDRVRVNAVAPGPTESEALTAAGLPPQIIARIKQQETERIPLGRRGEPGDIARWILTLAEPDSSWMTGQVITVDGGLALC